MKNNNLVFIIDDDVIQNEIHSILINKLFPEKELSTFTNSKAALEAIKNNHLPSLIFLDLHLPGEPETFFLDEYNKLKLQCKVYLLSSAAYLRDRSIIDKYPQVKGFFSKPLLDQKLREVFMA